MKRTTITLMTSILVIAAYLTLLTPQADAFEQKTRTATYGSVSVPFKYWSNDTFIINDPKAPVRIKKFSTIHVTAGHAKAAQSYLKAASYDDVFRSSIGTFRTEGLELKVTASTVSGKDVQAVKFGFVVIDAFNEYLGGLTGVTMDTPKDELVWKYRPGYLFKFEKYGKALVYVRQVRLAGDKIWNFDKKRVTKEVQKLVSSFNASDLKIEDTK